MSFTARQVLCRLGRSPTTLMLSKNHGVVAQFRTFSSAQPLQHDDELYYKSYQDEFDESDWVELGKAAHEKAQVRAAAATQVQIPPPPHTFWQDLKIAEDEEERAMKHARIMVQKATHVVMHDLKEMAERMVPSSSSSETQEELDMSFSTAFDESDAIEKEKQERMDVIAERVESCRYE